MINVFNGIIVSYKEGDYVNEFSLKLANKFTKDQVQVVLEEMGIKGKLRRFWLKELTGLKINDCVYSAVKEMREPLWISADELQRTLLKNYSSKWMVRQIISEWDAEENIETYFVKVLRQELDDYMACLSNDKTLFSFMRKKREIQFANGRRPSVEEEDARYNYYKNYKELTVDFDGVIQYRVFVFQLLYRAQFKKSSRDVIAKGFMKHKVFEKKIRVYEKSIGEKDAINRYWFYSLISEMLLAGEWIDDKKIHKCIFLHHYSDNISLDSSFLRAFYYEENRKIPIVTASYFQHEYIPIKEWQRAYFKNQRSQLLNKIDGCKDATSRVLYAWMFHENPWRFMMFQALLKRLHIDMYHPMLKDRGVFAFMMKRLRRSEKYLNQALGDRLDQYLAVMYYEEMKISEGQDYLNDILLYHEH
jgi:hypothetical protein